MRRVILVTGPPCAGKTTWVTARAQPGDTILDQDQLGAHAMTAALRTIGDGTTWVIRTAPGPTARATLTDQLGAEHVHLAPPRADLHRRAARRPHPRSHHAAIAEWFRLEEADRPERQPRRTVNRGAPRWAGRKGRPWRDLCAKVFADPDEVRCIRCRQPVDKALSVKDAPPELRRWARSVDHIIAIEQGGEPLSRDNVGLAHFGCNSRHGAHVRWAKHKPGHVPPTAHMSAPW